MILHAHAYISPHPTMQATFKHAFANMLKQMFPHMPNVPTPTWQNNASPKCHNKCCHMFHVCSHPQCQAYDIYVPTPPWKQCLEFIIKTYSYVVQLSFVTNVPTHTTRLLHIPTASVKQTCLETRVTKQICCTTYVTTNTYSHTLVRAYVWSNAFAISL